MHHHFKDITDRIGEQPRWYDEGGVPRYCDFGPDEVSHIYSYEAALVLITCQACQRPYRVAIVTSLLKGRWHEDGSRVWPIADEIQDGSLHYGDPPNAGCCAAGACMNCNDIRVLEYWRKEHIDWQRIAALEVPLADSPEFAGASSGKNSD